MTKPSDVIPLTRTWYCTSHNDKESTLNEARIIPMAKTSYIIKCCYQSRYDEYKVHIQWPVVKCIILVTQRTSARFLVVSCCNCWHFCCYQCIILASFDRPYLCTVVCCVGSWTTDSAAAAAIECSCVSNVCERRHQQSDDQTDWIMSWTLRGDVLCLLASFVSWSVSFF